MRRTRWLLGAAAVFALGGVTWAGVSKGGKLYITAKNTKVLAGPSPTANVVTTLQPGAEVTWNGADGSNKQFHHVIDAAGKKGLVFQSNLSPSKPKLELVAGAGGKEMDPKAFASSGAATKALSEGSIRYAEGKGMKDAPKQLLVLEALSAQVKGAEVAEHAKKAGLHPAAELEDAP